MKKIATVFLFFISLTVFSQVSNSTLIKYKKDYNSLEFNVKTKTDNLNHSFTLKMNKISFDMKQELNDLEAKYGSNKLKLAIHQNKYQKEVFKVQNKCQMLIADLQLEYQTAMAKIQQEFQKESSKIQLKYNLH